MNESLPFTSSIISSNLELLRSNLLINDSHLKTKTTQLEALKVELKESEEEQQFYQDVTLRLQQVSDKISQDNLSFISRLVNEALAVVVTDHQLIFNINTKINSGKKLYTFTITNNGVEGGIRSCGGGVWAIVAFTLNFCLLYLFTKGRVLFLDETLPAVSYIYLDRMINFMDTLSRRFEVSILLITQQQEAAENFGTYYRATKAKHEGGWHLNLSHHQKEGES